MRAFAMARKRATKEVGAKQATLPIALVFGYDRGCPASMLLGIRRYSLGLDNWSVVLIYPHKRLSEALISLKPAGIIVNNFDQETVDVLRKTGRPVVSTCLSPTAPNFHQVTRDEASIGSVAAKHLLECGLRNFGYFGPPWSGPTSGRQGGFCQTLQSLSYTPSVCYTHPAGTNPVDGTFISRKNVCQWVRQLPKPSGVFAPSDTWALWLCGVCRQVGVKVPEDIAIIGAENDELLCDLAHPSISSVAIPAESIGYEAAAMLDRLMRHEKVSKEPLLLPASNVVMRQSTNILVGVEPVVSKAVRFIREHFCELISVEDMMQNVHMHRRSFERKFRAAIGRSPAQEIHRMRIALAKTLLAADPPIKIDSIVLRCGFPSRKQFFKAIHQATGMTPADYRRTAGQKSI
jgi:LacI family transcriptional regulator